MPIFYYFLKRTLTGETSKYPITTDVYMGEIGDYVDLDGCGYIITDYAVEYMEMM